MPGKQAPLLTPGSGLLCKPDLGPPHNIGWQSARAGLLVFSKRASVCTLQPIKLHAMSQMQRKRQHPVAMTNSLRRTSGLHDPSQGGLSYAYWPQTCTAAPRELFCCTLGHAKA